MGVRLNRALVLEEAQRVPDGAGGFIETWRALGTLWAEVSPGTGVERAGEFVTLGSVRMRIVMRRAPEGSERRPRPGQRLREGARIYRILAVTDGGQGAYLTCFAVEEVVA